MARPSSASNASRLATSTTLIPDAAICRANSLPIPDEAPVTSAHGPNCPLSSAAFIVLLLSVEPYSYVAFPFGCYFVSIGIKYDAGQNACQMLYLLIGMKSETVAARLGRPRAFDPDAALERAMHVFWAKGYEGASLSDLTRAMRINRPSLYAAFGNKEQLFLKVLDRYMNGPLAYFQKALGAAKAREVIEQIFLGAANMPSDPRTPAGCLVVQGALACGDAAGSVRKEIGARRAAAKAALRRRLQRAKREGDLPS